MRPRRSRGIQSPKEGFVSHCKTYNLMASLKDARAAMLILVAHTVALDFKNIQMHAELDGMKQ